MRTATLLGIVLVFAFGMILAGETGSMSGKDLLDKLNSKEKCDNDGARGYITGVWGMYKSPLSPGDGKKPASLGYIVNDDEIEGVMKVAREYLAAHPEKLDLPANQLLVEAFEKSYPKQKEAAAK